MSLGAGASGTFQFNTVFVHGRAIDCGTDAMRNIDATIVTGPTFGTTSFAGMCKLSNTITPSFPAPTVASGGGPPL